MLLDPLDDNVIPIVEELQRRLPLVSAILQGQGEEEEKPEAQNDTESSEQNGMPLRVYYAFIL